MGRKRGAERERETDRNIEREKERERERKRERGREREKSQTPHHGILERALKVPSSIVRSPAVHHEHGEAEMRVLQTLRPATIRQ